MRLILPDRQVDFDRPPLVMGIVNINDDSFSGDGTLDPEAALDQAEAMVFQGADCIDVGAESARTNRAAIPESTEIRRLLPFLQAWKDRVARMRPLDELQLFPPILSVNTWRPEVANAALAAGGELLNDMSALPEPANAKIAAAHRAALLIMHSIGEPKVAHTHVEYRDVMAELDRFFEERIELALRAGMQAEGILIDPGIDFAKQAADNLTIYSELGRLKRFGRPILLPVSRKTVIGETLKISEPAQRDAGTVACLVAGMQRGASMFRVHNVPAAAQAIRVIRALNSGRLG